MALWRRDGERAIVRTAVDRRGTEGGRDRRQLTDGGAEAGAGLRRRAIHCAAPEPRDGTKISQVIGLLQRDQGATLDEVIAATGWLPHTSRAALTGLRKRGYAIERRPKPEGGKGYVIVAASQAQSA